MKWLISGLPVSRTCRIIDATAPVSSRNRRTWWTSRPMCWAADRPLRLSSAGLTITYRRLLSRTARPIGDWATSCTDSARSRSTSRKVA